jgi:hypothetical protein
MTYIKTISEEMAEGLVQEQYGTAKEKNGYVPNYTQAFSLHPQVYEVWMKLVSEIRSKMRLRRYELVTFAAAMALKCTY